MQLGVHEAPLYHEHEHMYHQLMPAGSRWKLLRFPIPVEFHRQRHSCNFSARHTNVPQILLCKLEHWMLSLGWWTWGLLLLCQWKGGYNRNAGRNGHGPGGDNLAFVAMAMTPWIQGHVRTRVWKKTGLFLQHSSFVWPKHQHHARPEVQKWCRWLLQSHDSERRNVTSAAGSLATQPQPQL